MASLFLPVATLTAAHPVRHELVDLVNSGNHGWAAVAPEENKFKDFSAQQIRGLMGLRDHGPIAHTSKPGMKILGDIPRDFDARTHWPSCRKDIRDQAHCGSCWAFGAAETLTDNLCVLGLAPPVLSPQDLVSCDANDHGCHGGTLPSAWSFIKSRGLVSDACIPYTSGDGSNATCPLPGCTGSGASTPYKCPVDPTFLNSDEQIQAAVMTVGAVEVGFFVMEDFMNYKSGVYHYTSGVQLGGHAVKVVGWGHELEQFYWIVQNSWGSSWGENGFFRIENWHDDMQSAFAIGGGQACVQGDMPGPPSPAPTPSSCADIASYCTRDKCTSEPYTIGVCKKTCGCCDALPPAYCANSTTVVEDVPRK